MANISLGVASGRSGETSRSLVPLVAGEAFDGLSFPLQTGVSLLQFRSSSAMRSCRFEGVRPPAGVLMS